MDEEVRLSHSIAVSNESSSELGQSVSSVGDISNCLNRWKEITDNETVLDWVRGYKIEFSDNPVQIKAPRVIKFSDIESKFVEEKVAEFIDKGIVEQSSHCFGEYISNIFLRPKRDGGFRLILNLSQLNKFVSYHHFKMEHLSDIANLVEPNFYFASIDLKDAYYSVRISPEHQKYLKFEWNDQLFQFTRMPNGLSSAPRVFTKVVKCLFANLRGLGYLSLVYLDDSLLAGDSFANCEENVKVTIKSLESLGFVINNKKSEFIPTTKITFLGFIIDSVSMTVQLTQDKKEKIISFGKEILEIKEVKIQTLASFIGILVSCFPGVLYGPLFYRSLERDKIKGLSRNGGNFEGFTSLCKSSFSEISWWVNNVTTSSKPIRCQPINNYIETDASSHGWGANHENITTGGRWRPSEAKLHINCLELLAVELALHAYFTNSSRIHIRVKTDSSTAVS